MVALGIKFALCAKKCKFYAIRYHFKSRAKKSYLYYWHEIVVCSRTFWQISFCRIFAVFFLQNKTGFFIQIHFYGKIRIF